MDADRLADLWKDVVRSDRLDDDLHLLHAALRRHAAVPAREWLRGWWNALQGQAL